jgi:hypothetical protein
MHKTRLIFVLALALLVSLLAVGVAPGATADPTISASAKLRNAVEPAGILVHERRLQRIANAGTDPDGDGVGTRASGMTATTARREPKRRLAYKQVHSGGEAEGSHREHSYAGDNVDAAFGDGTYSALLVFSATREGVGAKG